MLRQRDASLAMRVQSDIYMKKAIIFGSSGFVGSHLLSELLSSSDYSQVTAVVRKKLSTSHPKLNSLIGDFSSLRALENELSADEIFIALGTTRKNSPDQKTYYQVDHDYPVLAAQIAKERGAKSVFLVTAVGADPHSRFSYVRTKGETERDIIALDFEHTHIFRPSMITGQRREKRLFEKQLIDPLLVGKADKYRGIAGEDIAKAMKVSATHPSQKLTIYHWKEMNDLLHGSQNRTT
jgi:uncharacterized protein YbjT (DUF2867 family)